MRCDEEEALGNETTRYGRLDKILLIAGLDTYEEYKRREPNQSDGSGQFALVSSAVRPCRFVCIFGQLQLLQRPLHHLLDKQGYYSAQPS